MLSGEWVIRRARVGDARAIAKVHVESWKTTYRGIFPDELLDGLSMTDRAAGWRDLLRDQEGNSAITLVGCGAGGEVVGFVSGGKARSGELGCEGELCAIYVLREAQGKGLGSLLVRRFARELAASGLCSMAVWVLAQNPSRKFYERFGGLVIGEKTIEQGGREFSEVAYGWRSLVVFGLNELRGR